MLEVVDVMMELVGVPLVEVAVKEETMAIKVGAVVMVKLLFHGLFLHQLHLLLQELLFVLVIQQHSLHRMQ